MQYAPHAHDSGSRLGGLGLVLALHLVMIWALADGLIQRIKPEPPHKTDVTLVDQELPPPPIPVQREEVPPPPVKFDIYIPPSENFEIRQPSDTAPTGSTERRDALPDPPMQPQRAAEPARQAATPAVQSAGMLCQTMGRPEPPALGVEGLASFRVLGTVRAGRVVAVEVTALRSLGDRRAMRALVASLERTLRETYQCGSSDGQFTQDFDFRIE